MKTRYNSGHYFPLEKTSKNVQYSDSGQISA